MNKYQAPTEFIGRKTIFLESCESTNSLALEECSEKDIEEGLVYVAEHQTKGRGQMGNRWDSKSGENLLFSLVLRPKIAANEQFYLSKSVACGIIDGLKNWSKNVLGTSLPLAIKWPNDIYLGEKKIGGILIENQWNAGKWAYAVVGVGLNVNQQQFDGLRATSLRAFANQQAEINKSTLFNALCKGLETYYLACADKKFQWIDEKYHADLMRLNEWHLYQEMESKEVFDGKILQVNEQGLLLMEKQNGYKLYDLKEISFIFHT